MKQILVLLFSVFIAVPLFCQSDMQARLDYVAQFYPIAIEKMQQYGIPASITLAQGILESGSGHSRLAIEANNHFGIKCHKEWDGPAFYMDDDLPNECFRKYSDPRESYNDHSLFLTTRSRYAFLFSYSSDDYKKWAHGLKKAGYATNPHYAHLLIKIIEETSLHQYDTMTMFPVMSHDELAIQVSSSSDVAADAVLSSPVAALSVADFEQVGASDAGRPVYVHRNIRFIIARPGDTFLSLAEEFGLYSYQIYKNNELKRDEALTVGEMVYLERKNNKATEASHTVHPGESLRFIAQYYAVRLKKLRRLNQLDKESVLVPGTSIRLR